MLTPIRLATSATGTPFPMAISASLNFKIISSAEYFFRAMIAPPLSTSILYQTGARFGEPLTFGRHRGDEVVFLNKESDIVKSIVRGQFVAPPTAYQILHDEIVVDTVLSWTKFKNVTNYFFEPEIRRAPRAFGIRKIDKIPDAIVEISGEHFAIEVELSIKSPKRYRKALTSYAISDNYREVHFFTDRIEIKHNLLKVAKEIKYPKDETPMKINLINVA